MSKRGSILLASLSMVGVMLLWAVAAVYQVNHQTSAIRHGYRKSELFYLCKRATSRALSRMNAESDWISKHHSLESADSSTSDTLCWVEESAGRPGDCNLRCLARLGQSREEMCLPLVTDDNSNLRVYSASQGRRQGDFVAWTSAGKDGWESLPPLPGSSRIESLAASPDGDVYTLARSGGLQSLWRYRQGRGWVRCPDAPGQVELSCLVNSGEARLACLGSDNRLHFFQLQENAMRWESVEPPAGLKLSDLTSAPTSGPLFCAAAQSAEGPVLVQYSLTTGQWEHYPMPTRANYNLQTGRSEGSTGNLQDLSGGLSFSPDGKLFVASNEPGKAAAIYRFEPSQESSTQGEWQALPPLRGVQWRGNQAQGSQLFASRVDHLRVDEEGGLWAQLTAPDGIQFSDIHVAPAAAHP